jgi:hypothetical protein
MYHIIQQNHSQAYTGRNVSQDTIETFVHPWLIAALLIKAKL